MLEFKKCNCSTQKKDQMELFDLTDSSVVSKIRDRAHDEVEQWVEQENLTHKILKIVFCAGKFGGACPKHGRASSFITHKIIPHLVTINVSPPILGLARKMTLI
jgi:hypothetical protein